MKLDSIDKKILDILQENARITNLELANRTGISPPATLERVKRLEKNGVIKKYVALVNPAKINKGTFALVSVALIIHQIPSIESFTKQINKLEEVLECYHITGSDDFMLKIAVENIEQYEKFILNKLTKIRGVSKVTSNIVLSTVKYNTKIHID